MTSYYKLIPDGDEDLIVPIWGCLYICKLQPDKHELLTHELRKGHKINTWPNNPPSFVTEQKGYKTSKLCNSSNWLIISNEVKEKIDDYGFEGINYYPISLKNNNNYQVVMNIENSVSCLNHELSKYKLFGNIRPDKRDEIFSITKMVLDSNKIPKDLDLFRLNEYNVVIIVSSRFKEFWERNNFTGFSFWDVDLSM